MSIGSLVFPARILAKCYSHLTMLYATFVIDSQHGDGRTPFWTDPPECGISIHAKMILPTLSAWIL